MTCEVVGYVSFLSGASVVVATFVGLEWISNVIDRVQVSITTAKARNQLIDELHAHNLELEAKIEKLESDRVSKTD